MGDKMKLLNLIMYGCIVALLTLAYATYSGMLGYRAGYSDGRIEGWQFVKSTLEESIIGLGPIDAQKDLSNSTIFVVEAPRPPAVNVGKDAHDLTFSNIIFTNFDTVFEAGKQYGGG